MDLDLTHTVVQFNTPAGAAQLPANLQTTNLLLQTPDDSEDSECSFHSACECVEAGTIIGTNYGKELGIKFRFFPSLFISSLLRSERLFYSILAFLSSHLLFCNFIYILGPDPAFPP